MLLLDSHTGKTETHETKNGDVTNNRNYKRFLISPTASSEKKEYLYYCCLCHLKY